MRWGWTPCPFTRVYLFADPWWGSSVKLFLWLRIIYFCLYLIILRGDSGKLIYSLMSEWWAISSECRRLLVQYLHYLVTASLSGTEEFLPSSERIYSSIGQLGWKYLLFFHYNFMFSVFCDYILISVFPFNNGLLYFFLIGASVLTPKIVLNSGYFKSDSCHDFEASHLP